MVRARGIVAVVGCLLLVGCSRVTALKLEWSSFTAPKAGFTVLMPGTPTESSEVLSAPFGEIKVATYRVAVDPAEFVVVRRDYPTTYLAEVGPELVINNVVEGMRAEGHDVHSASRIVVAGFPAVEYRYVDPVNSPGTVREGRSVLVNNVLYDVYVDAPDGSVLSAEIQRYLASFAPSPG